MRQKMRTSKKIIAVLLIMVVLASSIGIENYSFLGAPGGVLSTVAESVGHINYKADPEDPELYKLTDEYKDYVGKTNSVGRLASIVTSGKSKSPFTRSTYRHASKFKGYTVAHGIDVSEHQRNIDWKKARRAGVQFAIIRVGYRGVGSGSLNDDHYWRTNIRGALKAGIKVGVYIYSQAITPAEARAEANYVLKRIKGYNVSLPVVLDYEFFTATSGRLALAHLTKRQGTDVCNAFCKTVENAGYTPMVYGNPDMFASHLYGEEIAKNYPIWLAHFGKNNGHEDGFATFYTGTYTYWQYTSVGHVPGISGYVDCNFWYKTSETVKKSKAATDINITNQEMTIKSGNSTYLYYSLRPAGCVDDITWTSSRPNVAYVKDGTVYGVSAGETVITATTKTGATDTCKITVSENMNNYHIVCPSDSYTYSGREVKPTVEVKSKSKKATSGKTKKKSEELFSGPGTSYNLVKSLAKGSDLVIYGATGDYYAVSYKTSNQTYYGYVLKSAVDATMGYQTLVLDRDYTIKYVDNQNVGTENIEAKGNLNGIYQGTISSQVTINQANIADARIDMIPDQILSSGSATPSATLRYNGQILKQDQDYTISYSNNGASASNVLGSNATVAVVNIAGINNFSGTKTLSYNVGSSAVTSVDMIPEQTYTGAAITPKVTVHAGGAVLTEGKDYTVAYSNNVAVGSGTATVTLQGAYAGSLNAYFPIVERDLADATVSVTGNYTFNQNQQKGTVAVRYRDDVLVEGRDFTCEYENNCCAGTATVTVLGMGNYKGSNAGTFTIAPQDIATTTVASIGSMAYTSKEIMPALQIKNGDTNLLAGSDYRVSYANNKDLGTAKVTITGKGNYSGKKQMTFSVVKRSIGKCSIVKIANQKYKKRALKPVVIIRNHGTKLKKGRDFTVSYRNNRKIGKATVTIKGKGKYTGTKKIYFRIVK